MMSARLLKILFLSAVPLSFAQADDDLLVRDVECTAPVAQSATVATAAGRLFLRASPCGGYSAEGFLRLKLLNQDAAVFEEGLRVVGTHGLSDGVDSADVGALRFDGERHGDVDAIHLDFLSADLSYVEYRGEFYLMNCARGTGAN